MSIDLKNYEDLITCEESLTGLITELAMITGEETGSIKEVHALFDAVPDLLRKLNTPEDQIQQKQIDIITDVAFSVINEQSEQNTISPAVALA